jgi:hypothetical protein
LADAPKDDETEFNETLKRMLDTKPKPHEPALGEKDKSPNGAEPKTRSDSDKR